MPYPLSPPEKLEVAQIAFERVASIATALSVRDKQPMYSKFGGELFTIPTYLNNQTLDEEQRLQGRLSNLMNDVENICSRRHRPSRTRYPLLEEISLPKLDSRQENARLKIQWNLEKSFSNLKCLEDIIQQLEAFNEYIKTKQENVDDNKAPTNPTPAEYPRDVNTQLHSVLKEHICCTCHQRNEQQPRGDHLVRLLLGPPTRDFSNVYQAEFDMLFSSAPYQNGTRFGQWQDVGLVVPWTPQVPRPRVRFSDDCDRSNRIPTEAQRVSKGQLCKLISLEANSRLCFIVQNRELQNKESERRKQPVHHIPGISLSCILKLYRLTNKMKVALAYILAHSVWQYYDSDWMKTRWTSETIQFFKEGRDTNPHTPGMLFAWKPYLSVHFGDQHPGTEEYSDLNGQIHRYPRIQALATMLVEIAIGFPLPSTDLGINGEYLQACEYSEKKALWDNFEYEDYENAVKGCLDPGIFCLAPSIQGQSESELMKGIRQRRKILYEKVVYPLERLLNGVKWMETLTEISPLEAPAKSSVIPLPIHNNEEVDNHRVIRKPAKSSNIEGRIEAKKWLDRVGRLNAKVLDTTLATSPIPIRIAVLDTGCDYESSFFYSPDNEYRLKGWKDWVHKSDKCEDFDGHGTHLVSLIMKIAPQAEVYVARVAGSPKEVLGASENVAEAILWASIECKADIISMSFGYADDQPNINDAIREATYRRKDSILFFAAASNYGANDKEMFPARHNSVFSIRATNAQGAFADFNPPKGENESFVFGTLGLNVPSAGLSNTGIVKHRSGTSVATAIAAGIAGTLLGYVNGHDIGDKMRTREGMQAIFKTLAYPTQYKHCLYLKLWMLEGHLDDTSRLDILKAALLHR